MAAQNPLQAYRVETTLKQDGTLTLDHLPFHAGEAVEVIILPHAVGPDPTNPYPLRGTPYRFDNPTEPVAEDDWEANQ